MRNKLGILLYWLFIGFLNMAWGQTAPTYKYYHNGTRDVFTPAVARFRLSLTNPSPLVLSGWTNLVGDAAKVIPTVEDPVTHIGLRSTGLINWNGSYGSHNGYNGAGASVDDGGGFKFPAEAIKNYWYNYLDFTSSGNKQLEIFNLDASLLYKITIVGSVNLSNVPSPACSEYTASGSTTTTVKTLDVYKNTSKYVELTLRPGSNGIIALTVNREASGSKGNFGFINAVTIEQATFNAPSAPQNFSLLEDNGKLTLSWSAPSSDGGTPIIGYRIYRGSLSGTTTYLTSVDNSAQSFLDDPLDNERTYYYTISAVNAQGEGVVSAEIRGTPSSVDRKFYWYSIAGWDAQNPAQRAMIYEPAGYRDGNSNKYPVILSLHGNEGFGTDIAQITAWALPGRINNGQKMECIVVAPQCAQGAGWLGTNKVSNALAFIMANYRADPDRIYLVGTSAGGQGVWGQMKSNDASFAAAIMVSGTGSVNSTTEKDRARTYPALFFGGDADVTQKFFVSGQANTMTWLLSELNTGVSKPVIPLQIATVKDGRHQPEVWDDRVFDKSKAYFDFEKWLLNFSRNMTHNARKQVELIEGFIVAGNYEDALFSLENANTYINKLGSGDPEKAGLQTRLNSAKATIDAKGNRYLVKLGSTLSVGNINSLSSGSTGAHADHLVNSSGVTSSINFQVVQQTAPDGQLYGSESTNPSVFRNRYFGFDEGFLPNSFIVNGDGGAFRFSGLDNNKKYKVVLFGAVDVLDNPHPAELTMVIGETAKYIFTPFNSQDYILFSDLAPVSGAITFQVKGSPLIINKNLVVRPHNATLQTPVSNISGYGDWNGYVSGIMLIEITRSP